MTSDTSRADIDYVRQLLVRSERRPTPAAIYLLWAAIVLVGFALLDLQPRATGLYWGICAPLGSVASALLSRRYGQRRGQVHHDLGIRHALHWSGMLGFTGLAIVLASSGRLPKEELGRVILLIVALGWWTAGVHFDRLFLWLGGLMAAGFVGTLLMPRYAWTSLGAAVSLGLVIVALRQGRTHEPEANR